MLRKSFMLRLLVLFLLIFSSQAALDMAIKFKDKGCEIIDSVQIAVVALLGVFLFMGLSRIGGLKRTLVNMQYRSPMIYLLLTALPVGLLVFLWKRYARTFTKKRECSPC